MKLTRRKLRLTTYLVILAWLAALAPAAGQAVVNVPDAIRVFSDVVPGHWAEKDIARMKAKGVVTGTNSALNTYDGGLSVTREQVVVMLLRVLNLEKEAFGKTLPPIFANPNQVSAWARDKVALAVEKGIVAGGDLLDFRPTQAAKRYEVAVFVARAMGLTAEATVRSSQKLDFLDARDVPVWATGYVAIAAEMGIMGGSGGHFKPLDPITRNEMAVMLSRVDTRLDKLAGKGLQGEVFAVSPGARAVLLAVPGAGIVTVPLAADGLVFKQGKRADYTTLVRGESLEIVLNEKGEGIFAEVQAQQGVVVPRTARGTIVRLELGNPTFLTLKENGKDAIYTVSPQAVVIINSLPRAVADLKEGQEVEVEIQGAAINRVAVLATEEAVVGVLTAVSSTIPRTVTMAVGDIKVTRTLELDTQVIVDFRDGTVDELYPGQPGVLLINQGRVTKVMVSSITTEAAGLLERVTFVPRDGVVVKDDQGEIRSYPVDPAARIRRNGLTAGLKDLRVGDRLDLELKNGVVQKLYAQEVLVRLTGKVQAVTLAATSSITVEVNGKAETLPLAPGVAIYHGERLVPLSQITIGAAVVLEVQAGQVVRIQLESRRSLQSFTGVVENINLHSQVAAVLVDGETKQVFFKPETFIIRFEKAVALADLKKGDRVFVAGQVEGGFFNILSLVVLESAQ